MTRHVRMNGEGMAGAAERPHSLREQITLDVQHGDAPAFGQEAARRGEPDSPRGSGDEGDFRGRGHAVQSPIG